MTPLLVELATEVARLTALRAEPLRDPEMLRLLEAAATGAADAVLGLLPARRARADGFAAGLALAGERPARGERPGRHRIILETWPTATDVPLDHLSDRDLTAWVAYHHTTHAPAPAWLPPNTPRDVTFPCEEPADFPPPRCGGAPTTTVTPPNVSCAPFASAASAATSRPRTRRFAPHGSRW